MPVKRKESKKMRKSRRKSRTQKGGEMTGMTHGAPPMAEPMAHPMAMEGGSSLPLSPHVLEGGRRNRGRKSKRKSKTSSQCGGDAGVLTTAAVPFGLLALQRFFKGSRKTKSRVRKIGRSFKRTFRRRK
jgi:hypothetical protein